MRWLAALVLVVGQLAAVPTSGQAAGASSTGHAASALSPGGPTRPVPARGVDDLASPRPSTGLLASVLVGVREPASDRSETTLWGWPLAGTPRIVRGFDPPVQRWLPGHRGVDLAGVEGERVLAVDDGVVTFSGDVAGTGVVSVTHASGLRSTYQPVSDRVDRGDRVGRGDPLGRLAVAGGHCTLQVCLHLGAVRDRDSYVDPTPLLLGVDLALMPVEP